MSDNIGIVTDSTCDIPLETAAELGIVVVPAYVNIGEESYLDGVELTRQEFYEQLPTYTRPPTTAAPPPGAFTGAYEQLAGQGLTEILSIHVASSLSGMLNAARLGAQDAPGVKVTLFDSQQLTMGLGLLTILAAKEAAAGRTMDEIIAFLDERVKRTYILGVLDTLEYLRRSGRVNWAQFGIGTLLRIKPLLHVHMGQVEMPERVRTSKRAMARLLELANGLGPLEDLALLHTHGSEEEIRAFREKTAFLNPEGPPPLAVELTPAIGAHLGPGGLGIACITAGP
ncbi:MAG TPA: DegV family protein [Anaerolineae bacterium]|jgi:DegV family protein with EDD domain|nr:DegV family protein [Anaerolineae bacterium]